MIYANMSRKINLYLRLKFQQRHPKLHQYFPEVIFLHPILYNCFLTIHLLANQKLFYYLRLPTLTSSIVSYFKLITENSQTWLMYIPWCAHPSQNQTLKSIQLISYIFSYLVLLILKQMGWAEFGQIYSSTYISACHNQLHFHIS